MAAAKSIKDNTPDPSHWHRPLLEANKSCSAAEDEALKLNKRLLDVTKSNKDVTLTILAATLGIGLSISGIGAYYWYTNIQLRDDALVELQTRKIELEIVGLELSADKDEKK